MRIIVMSDSVETQSLFGKAIRETEGNEVVGTASKAEEAERLMDAVGAEAVIVELTAPSYAAYELIDMLTEHRAKPVIAAITGMGDEGYLRRAEKLGAAVTAKQPVDAKAVIRELRAEQERRKTERKSGNTVITELGLTGGKTLDERLSDIFISAGIPPHIKGYRFLREAVKQSVYAPEMINNITKELYPAVAKKFMTSPGKVERAIRHAIDVAWSRGKIENINALYGIKVFSRGDKPTNGELIALVSDRIIIECS